MTPDILVQNPAFSFCDDNSRQTYVDRDVAPAQASRGRIWIEERTVLGHSDTKFKFACAVAGAEVSVK